MVNFVPTRLLVAQALVLATTAQKVGTFVYRAQTFNFTYKVDEEHKATFSYSGFPWWWNPDDSGDSTGLLSHYSSGPHPLRQVGPSTYTVDFKGSELGARGFHDALEHSLTTHGVIDVPDDGIQPDDLINLNYESVDCISTNFLGVKILFMRVGHSWSAGKFEYRSPDRPRFKLVYKIRADGDVRIRVKRGRSGTRRFRFKLSERLGAQRTFKYYVLEQVERRRSHDQWDDLLKYVKRICPEKSLKPGDLKQLFVASDNTINVQLEGDLLTLTRV
ncbi:hypothetical protein FOZ60_003235 [Perkinsus olseni]|uniref:Uncharacterized protein n=1 Tax=Perkinsus olseni TaxID=32597 RepID=A0A7J6NVT2_PEROL|nr:hypothetical protein FOZ60_003235 [Perkinsus olseni]